MVFQRNFHYWRFLSILRHHKPPLNPTTSTCSISSNSYQSLQFSSHFSRLFTISAQPQMNSARKSIISGNTHVPTKKEKKPLGVFFREAVGLLERLEIDDESESESESENKELKCKLKSLEEELRILQEKRKIERVEKVRSGNERSENESKPVSLHALFANSEAENGVKSRRSIPITMEDPVVYKELSDDMVMLATHLYKEGYFKDSNFLPRNRFDIACFENSYARDFVKYAAEEFGKDHQEIAKWLSGSDLKKVALFGCPSLAKKNVFSAKRLRTFFRIQENIVCSKCALKKSCKFVNQSIWKGDSGNLQLAVVMRVITLYALESVPSQLVVPDEIKDSVSRLLKDIVRLSQTVC